MESYVYRYTYLSYLHVIIIAHAYYREFFSPSNYGTKWGTISWGRVVIQAFAMALAAGFVKATHPVGIKDSNGQSPIYADKNIKNLNL